MVDGDDSMLDWRPRRREGVETVETVDGFLIHDLERDRVHYLNPTAVAVLEMLDGNRSGREIAEFLGRLFELPAPPHDDVAACLEQLRSENLLVL